VTYVAAHALSLTLLVLLFYVSGWLFLKQDPKAVDVSSPHNPTVT